MVICVSAWPWRIWNHCWLDSFVTTTTTIVNSHIPTSPRASTGLLTFRFGRKSIWCDIDEFVGSRMPANRDSSMKSTDARKQLSCLVAPVLAC